MANNWNVSSRAVTTNKYVTAVINKNNHGFNLKKTITYTYVLTQKKSYFVK